MCREKLDTEGKNDVEGKDERMGQKRRRESIREREIDESRWTPRKIEKSAGRKERVKDNC